MAVSNELAGRNALVTGATSGIGRAIAEGLARRGASVVLHGRESSRGDAVVQAIQGDGGVARYWASEFGPSGVRVNAVSPGAVHTEGTAAMLGGHTAVLDGTNARGRAGDPNEIADVVCFLLGPSSSYVNGAVLVADGGELSAR